MLRVWPTLMHRNGVRMMDSVEEKFLHLAIDRISREGAEVTRAIFARSKSKFHTVVLPGSLIIISFITFYSVL